MVTTRPLLTILCGIHDAYLTAKDGVVFPNCGLCTKKTSRNSKLYGFFQVWTCAEAHILLTTYYGVPEFDATELRLGEDDGTWVCKLTVKISGV